MRRTEPPPLATWILEHGIPGDHDEALSGDLLEEFRSGRSDGWFWRQALAAWFVGWLKYLSMRRSLLIFAALWSALAPAWAAFVDKVDRFNPDVTIGPLFRIFCLWVALNLVFVFAGMLLFVLIHSRIASAFSMGKLGRAFMLAPLVFLPLYFATFVMMNLFAYPGFVVDPGVRTPLGEITDFNMRAIALRIPYFLTMLWAMWGATPLMRSLSATFIAWKPAKLPAGSTTAAAHASPIPSPASYADPYTTKRFLIFVVGAGLLNALIAGFLLCRLPDSHAPTLQSLLLRATIYVAIGALAGIAGIYLYWNSPASPFRTSAPIPFSLFALACAAGWIWVPSMVIFSEQLSAVAAFIGAIGAFLLAASLRHATTFVFAPKPRVPPPVNAEDFELFAESLYRAPREPYGYVIALSLYAAGWALATHSNYTACTLLALGTSIFAWQRTLARDYDPDANREYKRAALRLALVFIPAVLVTIWALLDGVAHRNYLEAANASRASDGVSAAEDVNQQTKSAPSANGISGYHSVILWPPPEKKQIVAPLPEPTSLLAPGATKPLVIRFDGPYWYFQPPNHAPSLNAHQTRGTPLAIDIQTNNFVSLIMQAQQALGTPIPLSRCRAIDLDILNRDNHRGILNIALLLSDSSSPARRQLSLGTQTVVSSLPDHFAFKSSPARETLRFSVPSTADIRRFDGITILFIPDASNYDIGPKVAIEQFALQPR